MSTYTFLHQESNQKQKKIIKVIFLYALITIVILVITCFNLATNIFASDKHIAKDSYSQIEIKKVNIPELQKPDFSKEILMQEKASKIEKFYYTYYYNPPLAPYALDFVKAAEYYGLDYRLLPAISMVESTGGRFLFRKNNPFGWGKWGYDTFTDAIYDVSRGMRVGYYNSGLTDPLRIAFKYNPDTPKQWGPKVKRFMSQI